MACCTERYNMRIVSAQHAQPRACLSRCNRDCEPRGAQLQQCNRLVAAVIRDCDDWPAGRKLWLAFGCGPEFISHQARPYLHSWSVGVQPIFHGRRLTDIPKDKNLPPYFL